MANPNVREVLLGAVAPFLDQELYDSLSELIVGMDLPTVRHLFGQVDKTHQAISSLRLDILTLLTDEAQKQGLQNDTDPETAK